MKKTMLKRILSTILTVALIAGMLPMQIFAADGDEPIKIPATLFYQKLQGLGNPEIENVNRPISFRTDAGEALSQLWLLSPIIVPAPAPTDDTGEAQSTEGDESAEEPAKFQPDWNYLSFSFMYPQRSNISIYEYTGNLAPLEIGRMYSAAELGAQNFPASRFQNLGKKVGYMYGYQWTDNITGSGNDYKHNEAYDSRGKVEEALYGLVYDAEGNPKDLPLASMSNRWVYGYKAEKAPFETMTDREGGTTSYSYDESGNLVTSSDPDGHTTRYGYDETGRITSMTDGNGNVTSFSYDALGNLTVKTDAKGLN